MLPYPFDERSMTKAFFRGLQTNQFSIIHESEWPKEEDINLMQGITKGDIFLEIVSVLERKNMKSCGFYANALPPKKYLASYLKAILGDENHSYFGKSIDQVLEIPAK